MSMVTNIVNLAYDPPSSDTQSNLTEIVNVGAWEGPVILTMLYYISPGHSALRGNTAFFGCDWVGLPFFFLTGLTSP
jgi:hypothetical protein